jgi:predicted RNase H-like nuclease
MFDEGAPIWRFKRYLGATEDPEVSRKASHGIFIVEVFPAPARKTFRLHDWEAVIETVASYARTARIDGIEAWTRELAARRPPRKADQDQLDAVLCALIGHHWRARGHKDGLLQRLSFQTVGKLTLALCLSHEADFRVQYYVVTHAAS